MSTRALFVAGSLAIIVSGCSTDAPNIRANALNHGPTAPSHVGAASERSVDIERVRVFIREGRPQAFVEGPLGDGCTSLKSIIQTRIGREIHVTLTSVRIGDVCTMMLAYLRRWVPLEGAFSPGSYTIRANERTSQFQLVVDRTGNLAVKPDPGPLPEAKDPTPDHHRPAPGLGPVRLARPTSQRSRAVSCEQARTAPDLTSWAGPASRYGSPGRYVEQFTECCREPFVGSDPQVNAPIGREDIERNHDMRFVLMMHAPRGTGDWAVVNWRPEDLKAHIAFMNQFNQELREVMSAPPVEV